MNKVCLYYTAHRHDPTIEMACRRQLDLARGDIPLVAVGLKPLDYGDVTIVLPLQPGPLTLHKQILAGLKAATDADWIFFCENDVLYHPSHFALDPMGPDEDPNTVPGDGIYYNTNVWKVRYSDGHCVWTDDLQQTSGLSGDWWTLHDHYERRVTEIEHDGFDRHYEPGPKTGIREVFNWMSAFPNLDIRHDKTMTKSKWSPSAFRNKRYAVGWRETDGEIEGWGNVREVLQSFVASVAGG